MPICTCENLPFPDPVEREPVKTPSDVVCLETIKHYECPKCKGFAVFTWNGDGTPKFTTDKEQWLSEARSYNLRRRKERKMKEKWK